jgi:hypothetical protein
MTPTPPNFRDLFGDRYGVRKEPAANPHAKTDDPWQMQIPCRGQGVTIYPYGEGLLAVQCDHRRLLARKLTAVGLRLEQDGDEEKTFVFPVEIFNQVAKIVKPLRRQALTDKQRADRATKMKSVRADNIGPFRGKSASEPPKAA